MPMYRKKPVVIEAYQLPQLADDASEELIQFLHNGKVESDYDGGVSIETLEGVMRGEPGDYIVKGIKGEYYPVKPDIFEALHEAA